MIRLNDKINQKVVFEQSYKTTSEQTIDIDASGYTYYEVLYRLAEYDCYASTGKIPIGCQCPLYRIVFSDGWYIGKRLITVTKSSIVIGTCTYQIVTSTSSAQNDNMCVPIKIILYK